MLPLEFIECQWHQFLDTIYHVHVLLTIKKYTYRRACACFRFYYHLSARSARTYWLFLQLAVSATCCNGQHAYRLVGILGSGSKQGSALGTKSRWVGRILLVATYYLHTVTQSYCGTYTEFRVGCIAAASALDGQCHQVSFLCTQFIHVAHLKNRL